MTEEERIEMILCTLPKLICNVAYLEFWTSDSWTIRCMHINHFIHILETYCYYLSNFGRCQYKSISTWLIVMEWESLNLQSFPCRVLLQLAYYLQNWTSKLSIPLQFVYILLDEGKPMHEILMYSGGATGASLCIGSCIKVFLFWRCSFIFQNKQCL